MTGDDGGVITVSLEMGELPLVLSGDSTNGLAGDEGNVERVGVDGNSGVVALKRGSMFEFATNCDPHFRWDEKKKERAYVDLRSCLMLRGI